MLFPDHFEDILEMIVRVTAAILDGSFYHHFPVFGIQELRLHQTFPQQIMQMNDTKKTPVFHDQQLRYRVLPH